MLSATLFSFVALTQGGKVGWTPDHASYTLHNGWRLTPAGRRIALPGDMPGSIALVPDGRHVLVGTSGFHDHSLNVVDLTHAKVVSTLRFDRSWIGMATTSDGRVFLSGGKADDPQKTFGIRTIQRSGIKLADCGGFSLPGVAPKSHFVSGLLASSKGLYALNIQTDELMLIGYDGASLAAANVGYRPYGLDMDPTGSQLAVSIWGERRVEFRDPSTLELKGSIDTGSHPTALRWSRNGRLFVANSGSNTVSVVSQGHVTETIRTGIDRTDRIGTTPVALALSPDQRTLYVANAGSNCVAVIDVSRPGASRVKGFIPTEKYPTALEVTKDGRRLLVGTAKGFYGPNAGKGIDLGPNARASDEGAPFKYIGEQLTGALSIIDVPNASRLAQYTSQVLANAPLGDRAVLSAAGRAKIRKEAFDKVKHVIYIIRENRTYDQVLGDVSKGNGDPSLTIFGRDVTPNGHKIATDFALFDNLYTDGEVSQSGHQWTDAAYANDYNEKQWILSYSHHGEIESDSRLTASPGDYIWSLARKKGLWARVYGEYVEEQEDHGSLDDPKKKADPEKYGYSATFEKIFARGGRDTEKVADFLREMRAGEKNGRWPALMVMALPEDHTRGMSPGAFSPRAMVASNDLAVGRLVDAVSHSQFWASTAIFVIQDDAQDGPDHVDSHRTVGYIVSPFVNRGVVDHTQYSTTSMLRTMELMLGLPPMTQFDAAATPMYGAFTTKPNFSPFTVLPPRVDIEERNPKGTALANRSVKLDFRDVDRADFRELNHILWEAYRPRQPYPAPVRTLGRKLTQPSRRHNIRKS